MSDWSAAMLSCCLLSCSPCWYATGMMVQGLPRAGQMSQFLAIASTLFTRTIFGMAAYFR